jgi:nucleotide-binding universal stress UspA family protein
MDLSPPARYALMLAEDVIRPMASSGELHIVHVTPTLLFMEPLGRGPIDAMPDMDAQMDGVRHELAEICFELGKTTRATVVLHMAQGDPVFELDRIASAVGADLMVIGARRPRGWRWHRSLAARLTRAAPCSLLVARDHEAVLAAPRLTQDSRTQDLIAIP